MPLTELKCYIKGVYDYWNYSKEEITNSYIEDARGYIIIDGVVYKEIGEPRYVSMTFGLGHNHGSTSIMIDNRYNSNISKDSYFNALQREEAIKFTKERAIRRGDTNSINRIGESYNIEVLIPEAVKCNPQEEHGDGDPFLNSLYAITESSSNTNEAAILGMCLTASQNKKVVKFNIPEDYDNYVRGNGEGCWGYIENDDIYRMYNEGKGEFEIILLTDCFEYPELKWGTVCLVEGRGDNRPIVKWDWLKKM
jgi:hypothetical protein